MDNKQSSNNPDRKYLVLSLCLNVILLVIIVALPVYYAGKINDLSANIQQVQAQLAKRENIKPAPQNTGQNKTAPSLYGIYIPSEKTVEGELNFMQKNNNYYIEINTLSNDSGHTCGFSAPCRYDKEYERFECSNEGTIYLTFGRKNSLEVSEYDNAASRSWCGTRMGLAGFYIK